MNKKKEKDLKGLTEEEVLKVIEEIVYRLASKFRFGFFSIDDLKQEARMIAWEGLDRWDGKRSLKNFLWSHVHNRLFNFKRDKYQRIDKPCQKCPINQFDKKNKLCLKYDEELLEDCKFYYKWILRNLSKRNLMDTVDFDSIDDKNGHRMWTNDLSIIDDIDNKEMIERIKSKIPLQYLDLYIKYINGIKITNINKIKIKEIIINILVEEGLIEDGQKI